MGDGTFNISYLQVKHIDQLLALENKVYPPEYRSDRELTKQRLEINAMTDIAVMDQKEMMGYISLYPIPPSIYRELVQGEFDEARVEKHMLRYEHMGEYDAYLCSIVVDKERYPNLKGTFLFLQLQRHLLRLKKRGCYIRRIVAYAVSVAGKKTLQRMGFTEVKPNIFVYDSCKKGYFFVFIQESILCVWKELRLYVMKLVDV